MQNTTKTSSNKILTIPFHDYILTSDGNIINKVGQRLTPIRNTGYNHFVILTVKDESTGKRKKQRFHYEKLLLEKFRNIKISRSDVVWHIDKDENNFDIENLEVISKKEYNKRQLKKKKTLLSQKDVDEIKRKYNSSNRVLNQYDENYSSDDYYSVRKLAQEYNCSGYTIQLVLNGQYKAGN